MKAPRYRTRTKDDRVSSTHSTLNYLGQTGSGSTSKAYGTYREMSDVVSPAFFEMMKKGHIVMNRMSSVSATMTGAQIGGNLKLATNPTSIPKQWIEWYGNSSLFHCGWQNTGLMGDYWKSMRYNLISAPEISSLIQEVCTRCRSQIGRSNVDMWENLAEVGKTIQMLKHPIASWFKFEKKARIATAAMSSANAWLAYRYGIKPLVSSVNDVLMNLKKGLRSDRNTTRTSGVISRDASDSFTTNSLYWSTAYFTVERRRTETLRVRATSIDEVIGSTEYTLGLASKQLLTLPWELIPYSFVVDWFLNVGDYIGALAQSFYPSSLGQCYVTESILSEYRRCVGTTAFNPGYIEIITPAQDWTRADVIFKDRYPGLLGPELVVKSNFRLDSLTRVGDSLALGGQQILRAFLNRR